MQRIAIYGTGGFAREVLTLLEDINAAGARWELAGFLDDREDAAGGTLHGLPVLGGREWLAGEGRGAQVVLGFGSPAAKRKVALGLAELGVESPVLVHPSAVVSRRVELGPGTLVTACNVLTTDIRVGRHVILNLTCTVGHDAVLGDYATVAPGVNVSGNVAVGEGCDLGTGSKVIQGVSIGEWSVVGAGAVVNRDLPPNCTAVGIPAKPIKERAPGWHL